MTTEPRFLEIVTEEGEHCFYPRSQIGQLHIIGKEVKVWNSDGKHNLSVANVSNIDAIVQAMRSATTSLEIQ